MENNRIRVIVAESNVNMSKGINLLLCTDNRLEICGFADNFIIAIKKIEESEPDVIIIDYNLEGKSKGIDLLKKVRAEYPDIYTLIISLNDEEYYSERAYSEGASDFLSKYSISRSLIDTIININKNDKNKN